MSTSTGCGRSAASRRSPPGRRRRRPAPQRCTPTCGPPWARRPRPRPVTWRSRGSRSTTGSWPTPRPGRSSCTACPPTAARRWRHRSSTAPRAWCSPRPTTGSTACGVFSPGCSTRWTGDRAHDGITPRRHVGGLLRRRPHAPDTGQAPAPAPCGPPSVRPLGHQPGSARRPTGGRGRRRHTGDGLARPGGPRRHQGAGRRRRDGLRDPRTAVAAAGAGGPPPPRVQRMGGRGGALGQPGRAAHPARVGPRGRLRARPLGPAGRPRHGRRRRHAGRHRGRGHQRRRDVRRAGRHGRTPIDPPRDEGSRLMAKRVVLAYSGGLDTSVAVRWMIDNMGVEEIALAVDVGQTSDDWNAVRQRALGVGAVEAIVVDAREEFARDYCVPILKANALYEGRYPLVSALSRPVIVKHMVAAAREHGADAVAHGCTGKGNDQVRFEVSTRALAPDLDVLAPVRSWGMTREECILYAYDHDIPITATKEKLYSIDDNLWGRAIECGEMEDPWAKPPPGVWALTKPRATEPRDVVIGFEQGVPTAV